MSSQIQIYYSSCANCYLLKPSAGPRGFAGSRHAIDPSPRAPRAITPSAAPQAPHLPPSRGAPRHQDGSLAAGPQQARDTPGSLGTPDRRAALSRRALNHTRSNGTLTSEGNDTFHHVRGGIVHTRYMSRPDGASGMSHACYRPFRLALARQIGPVRRAVPRAVPHIRGKSSDPVGLIGNVSHACPRTCAEASQRLLESRASFPTVPPSVTAQEAILAPATRPAAASAQPAPARPARRDRPGPGGLLPRIRDLGDEVGVLSIIAGVCA
jgi:hypothetical protein